MDGIGDYIINISFAMSGKQDKLQEELTKGIKEKIQDSDNLYR